MPSPRSLIDRLRGAKPSDGHFTDRELDDLKRSICNNLERILNSRSGMSLACPTYGLPDFSQIVHGIPERVRDIEQALERCIEHFEPRVRKVEVQHAPEAQRPMTACFRIRAAVADGKTAEEIWFETVVVSSGRVRLT